MVHWGRRRIPSLGLNNEEINMTKRNYWLDLFTGATWEEFKAAGAKVSGFRESR